MIHVLIHVVNGELPWDLISEKICAVVNGRRQIISLYRLNCAMKDADDVCLFKR